MLSELARYRRLPLRQKLLVCEAMLSLLAARLAMALVPFRILARWLGTPGAESCRTASPHEIEFARLAGSIIAALGRRAPWDARCLAQAIAASHMLRRRGLEGTVTFGTARGESGEWLAHAWLRFGPCVITGGAGHQHFKVITTMARPAATSAVAGVACHNNAIHSVPNPNPVQR